VSHREADQYFGETPIEEIDQAAINAAAASLHGGITNPECNSPVYTPLSGIPTRRP
jgi:hypothetical protein